MNPHRRLAAFLLALVVGASAAEDIEPRRWTPLPVGTNVVGVGYVHTDGKIFFDPVLKIEEMRGENPESTACEGTIAGASCSTGSAPA
jgi:hypothetical protein